VAESRGDECRAGRDGGAHAGRETESPGLCVTRRGLADAGRAGDECPRRAGDARGAPGAPQGPVAQRERRGAPARDGDAALCRLDDADPDGRGGRGQSEPRGLDGAPGDESDGPGARGAASAAWGGAEWLACSDGKLRRVPPAESGIRPLAHGVPARVGRLRAYGNAIVPQVAAVFLRAYLETR
jgi:DNA (cytosine-5)-methyltransferase 1